MKLNNNYLKKLVFGIRFEKTFRILDIMGHTIDTILHDKSSPFSTVFFPSLEELGSQDRILINREKGHFLRLTPSDIIFNYSLQSNDNKIEKEINWFQNDALEFIIDKLIKNNKVKDIMRIGIMFMHEIEAENIGGKVISKLINKEKFNADQFTLSYGNKDKTIEGLVKKGVDDYINKITIIKQISDNNYDFTLDYQYHFSPYLDYLTEWNNITFFDRAYTYLNDQFYSMVNSLIPDFGGIDA
jgi:hypothetical protein